MTAQDHMQCQADQENARRAAAYKLAVIGWLNDMSVQAANGGPPFPFPSVPPRQEVIQLGEDLYLDDSKDRIHGLACEPLIKWGPDLSIVPPLVRTARGLQSTVRS